MAAEANLVSIVANAKQPTQSNGSLGRLNSTVRVLLLLLKFKASESELQNGAHIFIGPAGAANGRARQLTCVRAPLAQPAAYCLLLAAC